MIELIKLDPIKLVMAICTFRGIPLEHRHLTVYADNEGNILGKFVAFHPEISSISVWRDEQ